MVLSCFNKIIVYETKFIVYNIKLLRFNIDLVELYYLVAYFEDEGFVDASA